MNNLKLGVEVLSAHNLMPKDGQGTSSPFVEVIFDNQKFRTTVKQNDVNPVWNERFYFNVCLSGTSFVSFSESVALHYPLEKRSIFSRVKGELGLKVFLTDDPS
ncbi:hypothetical protein QJS10_CPA09g01661 [Acorus calamus]|uniref:C2 domain-containing protein n=1 Tax=Acorus calamus TaxID=4465 RepID=A0AAV9E5W6_ACOCL|nr:hypothetical protein QJS10_CPA09g01661 [Acorus calamus]